MTGSAAGTGMRRRRTKCSCATATLAGLSRPVRFGPADIATIAGSLAEGVPDGAAEREAISRSVQQFETIVGARTGTASDLPGMQFGKGTDDQMDCIDEATNTTSLLMFLASHGLLRHHKVEEPSARGFFLDGRYPHATAVLTIRRRV